MAETRNKKALKEYETVKQISELKGLYEDAKATGGDYNQFHVQAAPLYDRLVQTGNRDIADALYNTDYAGSLDILDQHRPFTEMDEYIGNLSAAVGDMPKREFTSDMDPTSQQWQDFTMGLMESAQNPQASETAQKLFDSFLNVENVLNGEITTDKNGNVVSGLNIDHYNTGKNHLDFLETFDVTEQPYFRGIMDEYALLGNNAAQGQLASVASGNSGNIDSFAQANANRQQLAFTTAGIQAALAAAAQNNQDWLGTYNGVSGHLYNMGALNNDKLGHAVDLYEVDSNERKNALNNAAALAGKEMTNNMDWYLGLLDYDKAIDTGVIDGALGMYDTDVDAETKRYGYETGLEETKLSEQGATERKGMELWSQAIEDQKKRDYETGIRLEEKAAEEAAQAEAEADEAMMTDIGILALDLVGKVLGGSSQYPTIEAARKFIQEKYPNVSPDVIKDAITEAESWLTNKNAVPGYNGMVIAAGDVIDVAIQGGLLDTMTKKQLRDMIRKNYPNATEAQLDAAVEEALASRAGSIEKATETPVVDENVNKFAFANQAYLMYLSKEDPDLKTPGDVVNVIQDYFKLTDDEAVALYKQVEALYDNKNDYGTITGVLN